MENTLICVLERVYVCVLEGGGVASKHNSRGPAMYVHTVGAFSQSGCLDSPSEATGSG